MTAVRREGKPGRRKVTRGAGTGMAALVALGLGCGCGQAVIRPQNPAGLAAATPARLGPVPGVNEGNTFATDKLNGGLSTPSIERSGLARTTWNGWKVPGGQSAQAPPAPESLVLSTPPASAAGDGAVLAGTTPAVPMPIPQPAAGGTSRPAGADPLIDACRSTKIAPPLRRLAASGTGSDPLTAAVVEARTAPAPVAAEEVAGASPVREMPPPAEADEAPAPEPAEAPSPAPEPAEAPSPAHVEAPAPAPTPAPVSEPIAAPEPPAAAEAAPKAPQAPAATPATPATPADPIEMPIELPPLDAEPAAAPETAGKALRDASETSKIEMPRPVGGDATVGPAPIPGTVPGMPTPPPLPPLAGEARAEVKSVDKTVERASRPVTIPMPSRPGTNPGGPKPEAEVPPLTLPALP